MGLRKCCVTHTAAGPALPAVGRGNRSRAAAADLEEGLRRRLLLEDLERLLEARNLRLAALLPLLVGLGLRNADGLELLPVLLDGIELLLGAADVLLQTLEERLRFLLVLRLVLDLRLLRLRGDLVLRRLLLVDLHRLVLRRLALGEELREVR